MDVYWAKCVNRSGRKRNHTSVKRSFFKEEFNFIIIDDSINLDFMDIIVTGINLYDMVSYWTMAKAILHIKMRYPFDVSRIQIYALDLLEVT